MTYYSLRSSLYFIILFLSIAKCQLSTGELSDLQTIKTTFSYTAWDLSNPCTTDTSSLTCNSDKTALIGINLPQPNVYTTFPVVKNLVNLQSLIIDYGVWIDQNFWEQTLPTLTQLNTFSAQTAGSYIDASWAFNIPASLKMVSLNNDGTLPAALFTSQILNLAVLYSSTGFSLPTLTQNSSLQTLNLAPPQNWTGFIDESSVQYFSQLTELQFISPVGLSWDLYDKLPNLKKLVNTMVFTSTSTPVPLPSSILRCKNLQYLYIRDNNYIPNDIHMDLSNLTNLVLLSVSGQFTQSLQYPGIIVSGNYTNTSLSIEDNHSGNWEGTSFSINNIDLTPFLNFGVVGVNFNSTLPDNENFYRSLPSYPKRKMIDLSYGNAIGLLPQSTCSASLTGSGSFIAMYNSFSDIPTCFQCAINFVNGKGVLYPLNPLSTLQSLSYYQSKPCTTFQVLNITNAPIPTSGGLIEVYGFDMGWVYDIQTPTGTISSLDLDIPNKYLSFKVGQGLGTGYTYTIKFHVGELTTATTNLYLGYQAPTISNYTYFDSVITINGQNLGYLSPNVTANTIFDNQNIEISSASYNMMTLTFPQKTFTKININVGGQNTSLFVDSFQKAPKIYPSAYIFDMNGGTTMITGDSFAIDPSFFDLFIEGVRCTIIESSLSSILFSYPSFSRGGAKKLTLQVNDGSGVIYLSESSITFQTPAQPCVPIGHGSCQNNTLVCDEGWGGNDCSSQTIDIPQTNNGTSTSITKNITLDDGQTVGVSTLISITEIREYNGITGDLVKAYPIKDWEPIESNDTNKYYFSTILYNDDKVPLTQINASIHYFQKQETIEFANETITMNPSTIKYQIELSSYHFSATFNYLMVVMSAQFDASESDTTCSFVQNGDDTTSVNSEFLKLQINKVSLYARFIKYAIIDSRKSYIKNTLLTSNQEASSITQLVGINVPYYTDSVVLDPDFSLLLNFNSAASTDSNSVCTETSSSKSKKLTSSQLAGIIIGSVCFVGIVVAAVAYTVHSKIKYSNFMNKVKRLESSIN